eukprot:TRINITY_DN57217_c0_g1_i1.p1 TRINITY_DN57217_c0_g1~~TRINITY_DN57217_c0_g1_i1.p1  ORF type:complete len:211 (-),score=34.82 TRINITY_DN57217_c0_g1_i1:267-899(-)
MYYFEDGAGARWQGASHTGYHMSHLNVFSTQPPLDDFPPIAGAQNAGVSSTSAAPATQKKSTRRRKTRVVENEVVANGRHCSVRKHARLGCAIVNLESEILREAVLYIFKTQGHGEGAAWQRDVEMTVSRHVDKESSECDSTRLFVHWGLDSEREAPIPVELLAQRFDEMACEVLSRAQRTTAPSPERVPVPRFSDGHKNQTGSYAMLQT